MKNGKHRRKLTTKQCCATSWGFLYLVFRHLKSCSQDLEKENQQNLCGFENNLQDSFWYYIFEVISLKQRSNVGSVTKWCKKHNSKWFCDLLEIKHTEFYWILFIFYFTIDHQLRHYQNVHIPSATRFSKLPVITGSVKLFCFPFQGEFEKVWKLYSKVIK